MDYGKTIKELRLKMLMSQAEFAKKMGVSYATVNRWERGHHIPTYAQRRKLASYFRRYGIEAEEKGE